jgi:subtilase family serine protease
LSKSAWLIPAACGSHRLAFLIIRLSEARAYCRYIEIYFVSRYHDPELTTVIATLAAMTHRHSPKSTEGAEHSDDTERADDTRDEDIMPRKRILASAISAGLAIAGLAIAGTASSAGAAIPPAAASPASARPAVATLPGSVASFTGDTRVTGIVPAGEELAVQLWLRPRTAAATGFAQAVSTPGSPQFRHYLSPDAYAARFGATPAAVRAVESWLRASGFTGVTTDPERAYVQASATAATINHAFDVRLKLYAASATVNAGRAALRANDRPVSLPTTLAPLLLGVTGLDNAAPADTAIASKASAATCSAYYGQHSQGGLPKYLGRTSFPTPICGYSAKQLRAAYGASMTSTGKGQTIALIEQSPPDPKDFALLQDYAKVMGLPAPSRTRFAEKAFTKRCTGADGAPQVQEQAAPQIEEYMDVEAAYAMAPGATDLVVTSTICGSPSDPISQSLIDANQAVLDGSGHHPLASIVSNSWDSDPEGAQPASETSVEHAFLLQAVAEGVGMYFASGDYPGVSAPPDDPYAIAVGATTLGIGRTGNRLFETGWSTGQFDAQNGRWVSQYVNGGSGGGPSVAWRQPAYQRGVVPAALAQVHGRSGTWRSDPDIAASGDPATAMAVGLFSTSAAGKSVFYLTSGGGTSQATPMVAAMVADAQQGSKTPFGFIDPVLYKLAGTRAFLDVLPFTKITPVLYRAASCPVADCGVQGLLVFGVQSDNTAQGYHGQVTLKGYDNMTGLGTPNGQYFVSALRSLEK